MPDPALLTFLVQAKMGQEPLKIMNSWKLFTLTLKTVFNRVPRTRELLNLASVGNPLPFKNFRRNSSTYTFLNDRDA